MNDMWMINLNYILLEYCMDESSELSAQSAPRGAFPVPLVQLLQELQGPAFD